MSIALARMVKDAERKVEVLEAAVAELKARLEDLEQKLKEQNAGRRKATQRD